MLSFNNQYIAKKAAVFNMKIMYHNRTRLSPETEAEYGATYCSTLHELLAISDVVSVSCPLNENTTGLIGHAEFAAMKDGVFFVNTARGKIDARNDGYVINLTVTSGAVVDETALKEALKSGKVARAGLDVFCNEPNIDPWFLESEQVIVQPHMGGLTDAAFRKAEQECFENIRAYFTTGKPNSPVQGLK